MYWRDSSDWSYRWADKETASLQRRDIDRWKCRRQERPEESGYHYRCPRAPSGPEDSCGPSAEARACCSTYCLRFQTLLILFGGGSRASPRSNRTSDALKHSHT